MSSFHPVFVSSLPLMYLHQAGLIDLLPRMYGEVVVVPAVLEDLNAMKSLGVYVPAAEELSWMRVQQPPQHGAIQPLHRISPMNAALFSLALTFRHERPLVLVEDRHLRKEADRHGLASTGTLGVILQAKAQGLVDSVKSKLPLLSEAGLPISPKVRFAVLAMAKEV